MDNTNVVLLDLHPEVPRTFKESLKKNDKYKWVYESTRVLATQGIPWSHMSTDINRNAIDVLNYGSKIDHDAIVLQNDCSLPGKIFVDANVFVGEEVFTDVAIFKGDVKWMQHYRNEDKEIELIPLELGEIKLKINALLHLHFSKYSGIIKVQTIGKNIIGISLFTEDALIVHYPDNWSKHVVRIYNNRPWGK